MLNLQKKAANALRALKSFKQDVKSEHKKIFSPEKAPNLVGLQSLSGQKHAPRGPINLFTLLIAME